MPLREPLGRKAFKDLASRSVKFTVSFEGEAYLVPQSCFPMFDTTQLTVVVLPDGSAGDVLVLPSTGNLDFKTMGLLSSKKLIRILVPRLDTDSFTVEKK
jgi:hypothetical protein